ncbi:SAM-dependent methyltransferase [Paractinoplanes lichenicola]|uniref:SAM-dependent methyltransferase n=1 Tax=Paractinoplanes lichenicola TaxID=2802976 RepID=A0ABS1W3R5_9ACTN|nr:SAM-dependent methyltransferase [Actinoplanes lichenicola]MBL7261358.1 SAM-dependent methyltransferase [Actinoplanes lichenicola]
MTAPDSKVPTVTPDQAPPEAEIKRFDPTQATPARRYNALLGGKDNFAADRVAASGIRNAFPDAHIAAAENRRFVLRMVRHLAHDHGVRQFLDLGCGLPARVDVHDVAQEVHPDARIVYVDNDPLVAVHARALMQGGPQGRTEFLVGDLCEPDSILAHPALRATFDPGEPVAVLVMAVLHFIPDTAQPHIAIHTLLEGLPAASYLAISHGTAELLPTAIRDQLRVVAKDAAQGTLVSRTREQVAAFADGLDLIGPGVTPIVDWLPDLDPQPTSTPEQAPCYGLLARTSAEAVSSACPAAQRVRACAFPTAMSKVGRSPAIAPAVDKSHPVP